MFNIESNPIDIDLLKEDLENKSAGALVIFEGLVRDTNEGKEVSSLEYEVYQELAIKEAFTIIEEAKNLFEIMDVRVVHREGHLQLGDVAIWIGVTSKHRAAAYKANQYLIDEIKLRLPIWKKEHYVHEEAKWVDCKGCYHHTHTQIKESDYYSKQTRLKSVTQTGQDKLKSSKVLVVGAGGLGTPALTYLALAGIGSITIVDHDTLEASNLHRQTLYQHTDVGAYKAQLAKKRLMTQNPFIKVYEKCEKVTVDNVMDLVRDHDLVLDCSDNFSCKFLLHDACKLQSKPFILASIYQYEGQLQTFYPSDKNSCLRCLWPDIPDQNCVGSCEDVGIFGAVCGVLGSMQAMSAINLLLNKDASLDSQSDTVLIDLQSMDTTKIGLKKDPNCPLCGIRPMINTIDERNYQNLNELEVTLAEINENDLLIDVRELQELGTNINLKNKVIHRPLSINSFESKIETNERTIVYCQKGSRSLDVTKKLVSLGQKDVFSLYGGVNQYSS